MVFSCSINCFTMWRRCLSPMSNSMIILNWLSKAIKTHGKPSCCRCGSHTTGPKESRYQYCLQGFFLPNWQSLVEWPHSLEMAQALPMFVSQTVKAVHLELASNLTSVTFICHIISRRGYPSLLWSYHGTNFVSANHELEFNQFLEDQITPKEHQVEIHPRALSHIGGL